MKFEKYKFRRYDKNYPKLFEKEKRKLKRIFPKAEIEHIGSTAIKGMGGKGIIDINLGIKKPQIKNAIKKLIENKYSLIKSGGDKKERWFFERDYIYEKKVQRIHIHLTHLDSHTWKKCLVFRDTLKNNKKLRDEYSKIKKKAFSKKLKNDKYRDYKKRFIENIEKRGNKK